MLRNIMLGVSGLFLALLLSVGQSAQAQTKVLFLGYDFNVAATYNDIMGAPGSDARFDYAHSGFIEDQGSGFTPTLAQLENYDSVLVWSDYLPGNGLGDVLADYVDAGHGVVLSTFDGYFQSLGAFPGRINTHGYNPFTGPTTAAYDNVTMVKLDPAHPILAGVNTLQSSYYNGDYLGVDPGATLLAQWSDGHDLAGISANGKVANIALFPQNYIGHESGDYQQLFRNSLAFTAGDSSVTPEGSSLAMLALGGLPIIVGLGRKFRRKSA